MNLLELTARFQDEETCRAWLEGARWPNGPVCPRCAAQQRASRLRTRPGQFTCLACRHRYSVTSATPMHGTRLPLRTWMLAMYLIATSSKGVSALKLSAWLGVSYRTAWHLGHRVRRMMTTRQVQLSGVVEVDETYVGGRPRRAHRERTLPPEKRPRRKRGRATEKPCVFVAVQRGGLAHAEVVASHTSGALGQSVRRVVLPEAVLVSDELPAYRNVGREFAAHEKVCHSRDEFARTAEATGLRVHTNTAESFNSTLKRALIGVYHQVSRKHLHRYAAEAVFRWNRLQENSLATLSQLLRGSTSGPLPLAHLFE